MSSLWQDLRYAFRLLLKNPGFTAAAIILLALGIGSTSAIFGVINSVLLRPLPYQDSEQLVAIWQNNRQENRHDLTVSYLNFAELRAQNHVFAETAAYANWVFNLTGLDEPERLRSIVVSSDFFPALGVSPILGRYFNPEEEQPGHEQVVVLSHSLWQRRFGSDPGIVGKPINLSGNSFTVVGVMPADFKFPTADVELWAPLSTPTINTRFPKLMETRAQRFLTVIARLKPGVPVSGAQAEMLTLASRLEAQYPDSNTGYGIDVISLYEQTVGPIRQTLLVLFGAVFFVLLIACANVANLLLSRAVGRGKELAIRTALGATRGRIIRQLLIESTLLAGLGGIAGMVLAYISVRSFVALSPADIPRLIDVSLDGRVLLFSLFVSLLTGLIFGLAPALQTSRINLNESMKEGGRGSTVGGHSNRLRSLLVVSEVALTMMLLIGAGLLVKSFFRMQEVNLGFDPHNVLTMRLTLSNTNYPKPEQQEQFFKHYVERLAQLPGVQAASAVNFAPLTGQTTRFGFLVEGQPVVPVSERPLAVYYSVTTDYFRTMNIPLLKGRYFTEQDKPDTSGVIIINRTMARRLFPNDDAISRHLMLENSPKDKWLEIVGVVEDVKQTSLNGEAGSQMYTSYAQNPSASMFVVLRTVVPPLSLSSASRSVVQEIDKDQPISNLKTMEQLLGESVAQPRFRTMLLGLFALVALVMAAIGIYGILTYTVRQRTHEIGIRMALGAQSRDIVNLVIKRGMMLVLIGLVVGLGLSLLLTRVMASLLYDVSVYDPTIFIITTLLLAVVAFLACYIPAHRATRVDPLIALRYE